MSSTFQPSPGKWQVSEEATLLNAMDRVPVRSIYAMFPKRSHEAVRSKIRGLRRRGQSGVTARTSPVRWTKLEDTKLAYAWGRLSIENLLKAFPGRTHSAIASRAKVLRVRADQEAVRRRQLATRARKEEAWTSDQDRTAIELRHSPRLWPKSIPNRSEDAIKKRLYKLLGPQGTYRWWSEEEERLVLLIVKTRAKLREHRTERALVHKLVSVTKVEVAVADALAQIGKACAWIGDKAVRGEVESELLVKFLAREVSPSNLDEASKRARTQVYGRRMLSLDAPVGDESGVTWIDTIASDREHV